MKKKSIFLLFLLVCTCVLHAQNIQVTGTVKDGTTNEPLIGASVMLKGTSNGTMTNVNGDFSINLPLQSTISVAYIGYRTQEVVVQDQNALDIKLQPNDAILDEVIVIGYGTAKKRDLTGSIASISAEDLANKPSSNALASLSGKVSGVQVINTGRAGQDPEIRIRGTNSINGYTPLYVVDGLFTDNISFLNPSDIESMEILKDPSSLAIFGVRGANGVIIITTKKAKDGQTIVNFNSSFGFKSIVDKIQLTNASQFQELYNEQLVNQGSTAYDFTNWTADTDWQDEIFQTGFITNNNVSITGATDKSKFYMGLGYTSEEGNIKYEKYEKMTVNLSSDYNLTPWLKFGFQFNGAKINPADEKSVLSAIRATPTGYVFNDEYQLYSALPDFQKAQIENPMVDVAVRNNTSVGDNYRGGGNIYGEVNFLKDFTFRAMYSVDYRSDDTRGYTPLVTVYDAGITSGTPVDTLGTKTTAVSQMKENELKVQGDYLLTYVKQINDHSITATGGFTTYYNKLSSITAERNQGDGLEIPNDPDKWYVGIGDANSSVTASEQWELATLSFLLRGLYNYKNKYLLNASFRRDGSSAFYYTGNQWQNFYSVGTGWIVSEEAFMENQSSIDYLKLKGSLGSLGNQTISRKYPAEPILGNSSSAVFGDNIVPGYSLAYLPDANLRWERIDAWEAGLEAGILRNRLRFEGVYYNKHTKDLLAEVEGISGTSPGLGNLGSIRNRGVELSASWNDRIGSDFSYSIGANLTTIDNKVLSLVQTGYQIIDGDKSVAYTQGGYPIGYFYGYVVEGVYQSDQDIANSPTNTLATVTPGDLKFADIDESGDITTDDRTIIGNPTPDLTYGITLGVSYKNFDLGIDMMGSYGNEIYRTWDNYNWSQFNYLSARVDRWHGEGTSDTEPLLNTTHTINNLNSTYYIEDGSFFRIRNVQLGYTFDQSLISRLKLSSLKIYANVQNLKTWKNNTGYTPEIGGDATSFGIDTGTYPVPAVYTFGLNVTF